MSVFYYNRDCPYCRQWALWCRARVESSVEFLPLPEGDAKRTPKFVSAQGEVFEGVKGIAHMLSASGNWKWVLWVYRFVPGAAWVLEAAFSYMARCSVCTQKITNRLLGPE